MLVVHDWGSALGFDWAYEHRDRVLGIAYMEGIVRPYADWSEWSASATSIFQGFRSEAGEGMILDKNMFVERVLPASIIAQIVRTARWRNTASRISSARTAGRRCRWPRQLPIAGEPPHIVKLVEAYSKWMSENDIPKAVHQRRAGRHPHRRAA